VSAILSRLPTSVQRPLRRTVAILPPHWRQGAVYRRWRRFLAEAQHWTAEQIQQWQLTKLQEIVRHAVERTEGYRELYREAGITPDDIRSLNDLKHLPFTTKELFRDNLPAFTVSGPNDRYVTTGGSTGIPFGFHEFIEMTAIERAFMHAAWSWVGWRLGDKSAVLRGGFVGTEQDFCAFDPYHRELALSSYYLTSATVKSYLEVLPRERIRILQAYPSSLNLLCDLMREQKLERTVELEVILLGSENVYEWQLQKFERSFPGARLFSWYGHCEKAVLAPWCEHTRHFHCWPFYGLTEVVDANGAEVAETDEGEMLGTSFHQRATPFIRYRTMDRALKGPGGCSKCGRNFPLLSHISGRSHEVIVTGTGRYISMTAINMHDDIFDSLRQFQFRQQTPGEVVFTYVSKAGPLPESELSKIQNGLLGKLGRDVKLSLEAVADIPRTKARKYRFLDQRLPIQYGDRP
jgi:phenylacetate-CoA ligase